MSSKKKTVLRRDQRTFLLVNLTLVAILAATRPSILAKVYAATNTYDWTKQVDQDLLGGSYTSVASSADGSHLIVGVTQGGEGSAESSPLYRSTNYGATWQNVAENVDPGTRNYWTSVDISNDGNTIVAASDRSAASVNFSDDLPGKIFVSHDGGDTWENISPNTTEDWVSIAIAGDSSKIVAVADDDQDNVYINDNNGDPWYNSLINEDLWHWESVSISDDGNKILVGGESNFNAAALVEISTNGGTDWDNISPNSTDVSDIVRTSMSASGDKIVVTNQGWNGGSFDSVHVSSNDGGSWTDITPDDEDLNTWTAVALSGDNSKLSVMDNNNKMYISSDVGTSWTEEEPGQEYSDTNQWVSIDFSDDGSRIINASTTNAYVSGAVPEASVTFDNAEDAKTVTLTTPSGTTITCHSGIKESALTAKDVAYSYPLGLVDFCFSGADASSDIKIVFITDLKPEQVVVRKYNPTSAVYTTIAADVTETTQDGQHALQIVYALVDNGPLDLDPDLGEVSDPVGIGVADVAAPNTGLGTPPTAQHNSISVPLVAAGVTATAVISASPIRRRLFRRVKI